MVRSNPAQPADLVSHGAPATSIRRNKNASTPATTATPAASTDTMVVIRPQGSKKRGSNGTSSSSGLRVTSPGDASPHEATGRRGRNHCPLVANGLTREGRHLEQNLSGCPQCKAADTVCTDRTLARETRYCYICRRSFDIDLASAPKQRRREDRMGQMTRH